MTVDIKVEHAQSTSVDQTKSVGFPSLEGDSCVLVESRQVGTVLSNIDRSRLGDRLRSRGVRRAEELSPENFVLLVVPIGEKDGVLRVVRVNLLGRVDQERRSKSVDVVRLGGRVEKFSKSGGINLTVGNYRHSLRRGSATCFNSKMKC